MVKAFPDITKLASAITNGTKMTILDSLMDKKRHTLLELAKAAHVTPQTASHHLKEFMAFNWISMEKSGRFHYFYLENSDLAELIEQLSPMSPSKPIASMSQYVEADTVKKFRSCYDHMAGKYGVQIAKTFIKHSYITEQSDSAEYKVTSDGILFLKETLSIDYDQLKDKKRRLSIQCLDWSEREHHIGGALGAAIFSSFVSKGYVERNSSHTRALILTSSGHQFLESL